MPTKSGCLKENSFVDGDRIRKALSQRRKKNAPYNGWEAEHYHDQTEAQNSSVSISHSFSSMQFRVVLTLSHSRILKRVAAQVTEKGVPLTIVIANW